MKLVLSVLFGAAAGWLYYRFVGCASGTCMITANPYTAVAYGAFVGFVVGS